MNNRLCQCFFYLFLSLSLLGCGLAHKTTVTQGTLIESSSLEQLEIGMSKKQVEFLMGYPILDDPFMDNQWKYIYLVQRKKTKPFRREVTLYFENDLLSKIAGDVDKIIREQKKGQEKITLEKKTKESPPRLKGSEELEE